MEEARPRLEVVRASSEEAPEAAAEPRRRPPPGGLLVWLLAGLLVAALAAVVLQGQRSAELSAQIEGLEAELGAAREALSAHERHLDDVRDAVTRLQALVSQEPVPPAAAEPPPPAP